MKRDIDTRLKKFGDKQDYTQNEFIDYYSLILEELKAEKTSYLESLHEGLDIAIKKLTRKDFHATSNLSKREYETLPALIVAKFLNEESNLTLSDDLNRENISDDINTLACNLDECIKHYSSTEYLYAHEAEQRFFYNANDHNDETAQMIKEYDSMFCSSHENIYDGFVGSRLEHFGITDKYIITEATEEGAYKVFLSKERPEWDYETKCYTNRQYWRPLATYGTGIIRIVFLVMNLVNLLIKHACKNLIVIIEEPEMNLHPKYQSLLADLFRELNERYGIRFIIETHSEYIIRKTQVAVKQAGYQSMEEMDALNPYKVLYFPQDGDPYEMLYRTDGKFCNKFGPGFYDEANNLIFDIL